MAIECSTRDRRFCVKGNKNQDRLHRVFIIKSSEKNTKLYIGEVSRYVRSAVGTQIRHPISSFQIPEGHQRQWRFGKNHPWLLLKVESFDWSVKMPGLSCLGILLPCLMEKNWGLWGSSLLPEIRHAIIK